MVTLLETAPTEPGRLRRISGPLLLAGGVMVASVALHLRDPHQSGSWGLCPWLFLTGTQCPGCGGLRAVNDLTRGDVVAAASSNLLFVCSVPLLVFFWGRWFTDRWRGVRRATDGRAALGYGALFLAVAVAFTVVRNLPSGSWLAP